MIRLVWHCAAAAVIVLGAGVGTASAASVLEKNFWLSGPRYDGVLPHCDNPAALQEIADRFAQKETGFWNSHLRIVSFQHIREVSFRPWAANAIPRRFCTGQVMVSDHRMRRVNYSIIEDAGSIGASWGVEWCVVGLDRNAAYNPACRMARP